MILHSSPVYSSYSRDGITCYVLDLRARTRWNFDRSQDFLPREWEKNLTFIRVGKQTTPRRRQPRHGDLWCCALRPFSFGIHAMAGSSTGCSTLEACFTASAISPSVSKRKIQHCISSESLGSSLQVTALCLSIHTLCIPRRRAAT